jgi:hypothetical protein
VLIREIRVCHPNQKPKIKNSFPLFDILNPQLLPQKAKAG